MGQIAYRVTATVPTAAMAGEYVDWLNQGHLDEVLASGALTAEVIRPLEASGVGAGDAGARDSSGGPAGGIVIETQYTFATLSAFRSYEQHHAPRLRADGLKKFGPERGIRFERHLGEIVNRRSGN